MAQRRKILNFAMASLSLICIGQPGLAFDWGYEESQPPQPDKQSAKPNPKPDLPALDIPAKVRARHKPAFKKQGKTKPDAGPAQEDEAKLNALAIDDWLELYGFVAKQDLVDEQKSDIRNYLENKIKEGRGEEVLSVLDFWPKLKAKVGADGQTKEDYLALLRALLRMQARKESELVVKKGPEAENGTQDRTKFKVEPAAQASEKLSTADIVSEILGPERIAEQGSPPLCEDAINAYADMACFLYEEKNPGKTVDARDNRTLFARVIVYKFKKAPNLKAREAMANFDVTWSVFKIEWAAANDAKRSELLDNFGDTACGASANDPTLKLVLTKGPWKTNI